MIKEISRRSFKNSKLRNRASVISILLITIMYTIVNSLVESYIHYHVKVQGNDISKILSDEDIISLFFIFLLIFISGYLIMYNTFQISVITDIRFYGRIKAMGGTPSQIRRLLYTHVNKLCLVSIPLGVTTGYALGVLWIIPIFLRFQSQEDKYFKTAAIIVSIAMSYLTVIAGCKKPASAAGKISVIDAMKQVDVTQESRKKSKARESKSAPVLFQMSLLALGRNRKRTAIIIFSITIGMVLISSVYAVRKSFDEGKYLQAFMISDYVIFGGNQEDFKEMVRENIDQIEDGSLYAMESQIKLDDDAYKNITEFYDSNNKELSEYMSIDPEWAEGYYAMQRSHTCKVSIFGADGLVFDSFYKPGYLLEGKIDSEKFYSGNYAIVEGVEQNSRQMRQPTYDVGDKVVINGQSFEIMAIVAPINSISRGYEDILSGFQLTFYIPADKFLEMNPGAGISKYFFNVREEFAEIMEKMLEGYIQERDVVLTSMNSVLDNYYEQIRSLTVVAVFMSFVIMLIGIINFINSLVATIINRRRELYMMQNIGLTKSQLRRLLMYEGLDYVVIALFISYVLSSVAVGFGVEAYSSTVWCATYQFTLTPLLICTPLMLMLSLTASYLCYKFIEEQRKREMV